MERARPDLRPMKVGGFSLDPQTHEASLVLTDESGKKYLPMVIGHSEFTSIALAMQGTPPPRPLAHDLMKSLIDAMHAGVVGVVIEGLRDNVFHARVELDTGSGVTHIDARPSDAIALAVRAAAPIYVVDSIDLVEFVAKKEDGEQDIKAYVDNLKPSDFLPPAAEEQSGLPDMSTDNGQTD